MYSFSVFIVFALASMIIAEPPSGYSYPRGGGGFGGGGFGGGGFGSSGFGGGGFGSSGSGGYQAVSGGFQTSEGQNVDPQLLEQVRQILLNEENKSGGGGGGGGGYPRPPSSSYGVPSPQYGVPGFGGGRVVGIDLEGIRQAIQVAQFAQQSSQAGGGFGGYPSRPSGSYGVPY